MTTIYLTIKILGREVRLRYDPDSEEIDDITLDLGCGRYASIENADITDKDEWRLIERRARDAWESRQEDHALARAGL